MFDKTNVLGTLEEKPFIIAEIGINWNGDLKLAQRMIQKSKEAGADAVKFQAFNDKHKPNLEKAGFDREKIGIIMSSAITKDNIHSIKGFCDNIGIEFICTAFHPESVELIKKYVRRIKIKCSDGNTLYHSLTPLLKEALISEKELIVSVNGFPPSETTTLYEKSMISIDSYKNKIQWLNCVQKYPCKISEIDFTAIRACRGWSNHCPDMDVWQRVANEKPEMVEIHVTLDKKGNYLDNPVSLDFTELGEAIKILKGGKDKLERIWIPYTERSELVLITNLIERLKTNYDVVDTMFLNKTLEQIYSESYNLLNGSFDLAIIPFDRQEQVFTALAAHNKNIPILHLYSGDYGTNSPDEYYRFFIASLAEICTVHSKSHVSKLIKKGIPKEKIKFIGSFALDYEKTDFDEIKGLYGLQEKYDVVLLHPDPTNKEKTLAWCKEIQSLLDKHTLFVHPNNDANREIIVNFIKNYNNIINIPHADFLSIMANAKRCIGNSSSFALEAPFMGQNNIVWIGDRNKNRIVDKEIVKGATDKVIETINNFIFEKAEVGGNELA